MSLLSFYFLGKTINNAINYGIYEYDEYRKCVIIKQLRKEELLKEQILKELLKEQQEEEEETEEEEEEETEDEEAEADDDKKRVLKILENIDIDDIIKEFQIKK
jgi:ABC-type Zn2+ transport system substrate-binding protein/surface adhesin